MKASEAIKQLEILKSIYGDFEIICYGCNSSFKKTTEIIAYEDESEELNSGETINNYFWIY